MYIEAVIQGAKQTQSAFLPLCWCTVTGACVLQKEHRRNTKLSLASCFLFDLVS